MPNDCFNRITLTGNKETIEALVAANFKFSAFFPRPEGLSDDEAIEWSYENWGTKWDGYEMRIVRAGVEALDLRLMTAWAPPTRFFEALLTKFHDLWIKCEWHEEGGCAGVWVARWSSEENKPRIIECSWDDMCLEEEVQRFREKDYETQPPPAPSLQPSVSPIIIPPAPAAGPPKKRVVMRRRTAT